MRLIDSSYDGEIPREPALPNFPVPGLAGSASQQQMGPGPGRMHIPGAMMPGEMIALGSGNAIPTQGYQAALPRGSFGAAGASSAPSMNPYQGTAYPNASENSSVAMMQYYPQRRYPDAHSIIPPTSFAGAMMNSSVRRAMGPQYQSHGAPQSSYYMRMTGGQGQVGPDPNSMQSYNQAMQYQAMQQ
ncbi:hypothetical protein DAKH74_039110 [Maudiozyma humilis]|uniref:Uncharacterized protein n=1 Tax=Maudiozyma humilis TaxID=51915 RepID=A0AAV5S0A6_MAUHU|nr:hypothetical protein DAKH74_039110 [Kazachstania humilis]